MKTRLILFTLIVFSLASCQEKFSGASEVEFESSKAKVLKDLTAKEQENVEKALRVVVLYAMSERWNKSTKYTDKSLDEITLDIVNNKTYSDLVDFAEDYLKKENEEKIKKIATEISEIESNRKKTDSIINILADFQPGEIKIRKGNWEDPEISVEMLYKGDLAPITEYMFDLKIYSISQNKKIDGVGTGSRSVDGISKDEDDFFAYVSRSLSSIMEKSKRLQKQLENPKYPITSLDKYDLRVEVIPTKIVLKDGTRYDYPEKSLADYDAEIEALQKQLEGFKSLEGKLDELKLEESDSIANNTAYNQEFLPLLKEIRNAKNKAKESILSIDKNTSLTFPSKYEVKKQKSSGMYAFSLSDSLTFDNSDANLIQYQIRDTTYVEYEDKYDKANGVLNILKKKKVYYNIKETIEAIKTSGYYKLVDADDTGYIYAHFDDYSILRYFKIKDTHYLYVMNFKHLEDCVKEFDRSKKIIKNYE